MKRRRIKKSVYLIGIVLILVIVFAIFLIRYLNSHNTSTYKLKRLGYQKQEIAVIEKYNKQEISNILSREYNKWIPSLMKEKYFLFENLDRYWC